MLTSVDLPLKFTFSPNLECDGRAMVDQNPVYLYATNQRAMLLMVSQYFAMGLSVAQSES